MADIQVEQMVNRLYSLLPRRYRTADIGEKKQLERYLRILVEGGLYPSYQETKGILDLINVDTAPKEFLPFMASELGFAFPYDLDEQTQRTYIKNAVASYKLKGTKQALEFMIRELTRFNTTITVDELNRHLEVQLEVDLSRQDFDQVSSKLDFLIREYAPPVRSLDIINFFIWEEDKQAKVYEDLTLLDIYTIDSGVTDAEIYGNRFFLTNDVGRTTNDETVFTGFGEIYTTTITEEVLPDRIY